MPQRTLDLRSLQAQPGAERKEKKKKEKKERGKFALSSDHKGGLLRLQPGASQVLWHQGFNTYIHCHLFQLSIDIVILTNTTSS